VDIADRVFFEQIARKKNMGNPQGKKEFFFILILKITRTTRTTMENT
jgi:hypothetical protein